MFRTLKMQTLIYAIAKYASVLVGIIVSAVLSRLLTPADYGIVAVVTVFTMFFSTLCNVGLSTAVVQRRDLNEDEVNDIYSFSVYLSIALMIVFAVCSFPVAAFYNDEIYVPVCMCLSVSVLFNSLNMIPEAVLMRNHRFNLVSVRTVVCAIVSGVIAIIMAFLGFKHYALVAQSIIAGALQYIWNRCNVKLKMKVKFNFEPLKSVSSYSLNQFFYNISNYFAQNLDNLLTGKLIGSEALAYYNKSYTLMRYPVNNIPHAITPILHPILSEHQKDPRYIYEQYIRMVKILSILGAFCTLVCFFAGDELIYIFFGNQWQESIRPFKLLSLCLWAQMVNALAGAIYQSIGRTKEMFHSGIVHISISILGILIGSVARDINVLSLCVSLSLNIKFFVESYFLVKKSFGYKLLEYYKCFFSEWIMTVVIAIIINLLFDFYLPGNIISSFVYKLCITSVLFLVGILITGDYKKIIRTIKNK